MHTGNVLGRGAALAMLLLGGCSEAPEPASGDDDTAPEAKWSFVAEDLPGAVFSVNGNAADDVWIAGSNRGDGRGPLLSNWDGDSWAVMDTGLDAVDLLWVSTVEDEVFAVGSSGTVLRGDRKGFDTMATETSVALWGVWGARANDVWAVGGTPSGGTGVVLHFTGEAWEAVDLEAQGDELPTPSAWYKVWGRARNDVYFCGTEGALMHWDGSEFQALDSATTRTLLTIHGRRDGSLVTAVGGQFTATLVASQDGEPFADVTPKGETPLGLLGVNHAEDFAYAVGLDTFVLRQDGEGPWKVEETGLLLFQALHGVWIDPDGGVWATGGQVQTEPYELGQVIYRGQSPPDPYED